MSVIAELSMSSPRMILYEATTSVPNVTFDVESVDVADGGDTVKTVAWAIGDDLSAFDDAMRADSTTTSVTLLDQLADRRLYSYQNADASEVQMYTEWLDLGAAQLHVESQNGVWFVRVRFPDRDALASFREICTSQGVAFTLHCIYSGVPEADATHQDPLTDAQREAVRVALDVGYLDVPRSASLSAVSEQLGVTEQSASERLRRATRNLAANAVD
ncbi:MULTISPECIES: helix-turn-helix domain-containing protein [Halobacterium]|uniref:HTH-10 family transcription regulator n=4 Tax=Halobacterium salinarum TaxID=2242 RepID=Q9HR58_HALSA|nr:MULTISPECIES: helix-turn-helix domain-containing protein [Halobacterium]AAG19300.1 conserved hypothetical protein [Halobacterium salinarum NRC-1]MBB6090414.1 hypothetical protein [Halobacterium salinarum]MCF2206908.1 helix-turn-helix domain-containing protein [Halobacterium salinarum]MDL0120856.1 helix-turn-helix domain-containing protein [Halobacterium salinarum]MDL0121633.1 helix-turn-helix domain-containing protein [Halobacterium salinarum]